MNKPLSLHFDPETGSIVVQDADDVWIGYIDPDGTRWRNHHCVEVGSPVVPCGPFETVEAAFQAYRDTLSS